MATLAKVGRRLEGRLFNRTPASDMDTLPLQERTGELETMVCVQFAGSIPP